MNFRVSAVLLHPLYQKKTLLKTGRTVNGKASKRKWVKQWNKGLEVNIRSWDQSMPVHSECTRGVPATNCYGNNHSTGQTNPYNQYYSRWRTSSTCSTLFTPADCHCTQFLSICIKFNVSQICCEGGHAHISCYRKSELLLNIYVSGHFIAERHSVWTQHRSKPCCYGKTVTVT